MSLSGNASIARFLTPSQRSELASALAAKILASPRDGAVLTDLLPLLEKPSLDAIYPDLFNFVIQTSGVGNDECIQASVQLMARYPDPSLREDFLKHALAILKLHVHTFDFIPAFQKLAGDYALPDPSSSVTDDNTDMLALLRLLAAVFTEMPCDSIRELDEVLTLFLGHKDAELSSLSSKLLRWRSETIKLLMLSSVPTAQLYWNFIFLLTGQDSTPRATVHGFVMWLRLLNTATAGSFKSNEFFQENVIAKNNYWFTLQKHLASPSHEVRKFCLSILQLSLKSIGSSFNTEILTWDLSRETQFLLRWSKFTTLFEVLAIDTSLHQAQAAYHDILDIITPDSLVHASWGFCLLATGFQASIDAVRKYSMHILFSIKDENMHLIKHGLQYLEECYLPYMMLSRHFVVRTEEGVSKKNYCEYSEKFTSFISSMFANLHTQEEVARVSLSLMTVLVDRRETFDAVRIYATLGMVKGLSGKRVLTYGVHDRLLVKLFDNFSEGDLFWRVVQTLNLRIILSFELTSLSGFAELISKFNCFNGFQIFNDNISLIVGYLKASAVTENDILDCTETVDLIETQVSLLRLAAHMSSKSCFPASCSGLLASKLVESGAYRVDSLDLVLAQAVSAAVTGDESEDVYLSLGNSPVSLPLEKSASLQVLWNSIVSDNESSDYGVLRKAYAKILFLNKLIQHCGFVNLELRSHDILGFSQSLFRNSAECARNVGGFYKLRDNMVGELHNLLFYHVKYHPEGCHLSSILSIFHFGSTQKRTVCSICDTITLLLDRNSFDNESLMMAMTGISETVVELDADRFKLSDRDLHVKLIKLMFHEAVLTQALHNKLFSDIILAFSEVVIMNSYGRRGLMPPLVKALSDYQVKNPAQFERLALLPEFLVKAMSQNELQLSAFKLEPLVGQAYDSELAPSPGLNLFGKVYGVDEVAYKVWLLGILNSIKTSECSENILNFIFSDENAFYTVTRPSDGLEENFRIQISKIVISVLDNIAPKVVIERYLETFIGLVETDPSPPVRVYFEWIIAKLLLAEPQFSPKIYNKLEASIGDHEMKPILVIAYERMIFLMIQSMDRKNAEIHLTEFIPILVSVASTNKATTRHFSMSLAISVHEEIRKKNLFIEKALFQVIYNMYKSALSTDAYGQFRSGDAYLWNVTQDHNLINISGGILLRLFDRQFDFLTEQQFEYLSAEQRAILRRPIGLDQSNLWVSKLKAHSKSTLQESSAGVASSLQTKSGAWSTIMDMDEKARGGDLKRSDLIVVASMVDKPPNLGGICRLCDVMGAGLLTLHDLKVKQSQQFKSVAVTADFWMPMAEVKAEKLVEFLRLKKRNGYTLIGLEQTDNSVVLDEKLRFPRKSLLLLGKEKEGIAGELLAELDFCVEIKQFGVVRSMNIQTATAVVVHAYTSQHC